MTPVSLYITASNREEAISLSHELLSARLIACANIIDHATSLYRWQGRIEHENESLIIAKSVASHVEAITAKVKQLHSYDMPCVVSVPINGGSQEFLAWIGEEVAPPEQKAS